ncbi:MAG TPA: hypothetical protein VEB62_15880 [Brevundimonas sp.]|nr:hypothetical protein [Brevundimonas sp.]
MLLLALLHVLSQDPPTPSVLPPAPVPVPSLPAGSRVRRPEYQIGRSPADYLVYQGRFTEAGVEALRPMIRPDDTVVVSGDGGDLASALKIAHMVNAAGGSVRMSGHCYRECAAIATVADRFVVPHGASLLFTRSSLLAADNPAGRSLAACIPAAVPDRGLAWLAPGVIAGAGLTNIEIEWSLDPDARASYERLTGREIAWIDAC